MNFYYHAVVGFMAEARPQGPPHLTERQIKGHLLGLPSSICLLKTAPLIQPFPIPFLMTTLYWIFISFSINIYDYSSINFFTVVISAAACECAAAHG